MKKTILIIAAVLTVISLDAQSLTVLHFNDTHSHVDPQRSGEYKGLGGVVEQAAYVDSVRKADGKKNVLLLHAGDFGQGTSYFTELGGNIEIDVMNSMKFDVVALGNHEFDNGIVELARRLGVSTMLITNAAGGIRQSLRPGDMVAIRDHLRLTDISPLRGAHNPHFGPRFPDQSAVYNQELIQKL